MSLWAATQLRDHQPNSPGASLTGATHVPQMEQHTPATASGGDYPVKCIIAMDWRGKFPPEKWSTSSIRGTFRRERDISRNSNIGAFTITTAIVRLRKHYIKQFNYSVLHSQISATLCSLAALPGSPKPGLPVVDAWRLASSWSTLDFGTVGGFLGKCLNICVLKIWGQ